DDSYGSWFKSAFYFRLALQELQLMYNYVAPEQILEGELDRYTLLYLPMTCAISDELGEALVDWVEGGGTLIADHRFAITDERGAPRDDALLERLFGVRRAQPDAVYELATLTGPGGQSFETSGREIVEMVGDADCDASYADGTPAVIFREVGAGRTAYINGILPKYDPTVVRMIDELMRESGVERHVRVDSADPENPARAWECARYELGEAEIVGLIRDHRLVDEPQTCEVSFGRTAHIYDMRAREYIGETEKNLVTLGPGETAMFAVLPYEVTGVQITGDLPDLRASVVAEGDLTDHVLHVTVTDPRGDPAPAYTRNVLAPGGSADLRIPLALNDAAGEWTVTVRDVLSGVEASATFTR
ncbi:MAG: beta-galactosidase trimerization domain-containing protein, partial [Armatimonadota bacterium]